MPPTAYTEAELKTFLVATLGEVATILTWTTTSTPIVEAISDTLLAYGVSDIATITGAANIAKLRAVARLMAWRAAVTSLSARFDTRSGTFDYKRSQAHKMAMDNLALAEAVAGEWGIGAGYSIPVDKLTFIHDPYAALPDDVAVR